MNLFLVIDDDNHSDPEYHLWHDKDAALAQARELSDEAKSRYGDMERYVTEFDDKSKWLFYECGEERWKVTVKEVKINEDT